jgi:hypothetical protein
MLFPPNEYGSYFILGEQNPNKLKSFTTDSHNEFVRKKEGNIQYWNVSSGDITYQTAPLFGSGGGGDMEKMIF